jgi:hypothetical protein
VVRPRTGIYLEMYTTSDGAPRLAPSPRGILVPGNSVGSCRCLGDGLAHARRHRSFCICCFCTALLLTWRGFHPCTLFEDLILRQNSPVNQPSFLLTGNKHQTPPDILPVARSGWAIGAFFLQPSGRGLLLKCPGGSTEGTRLAAMIYASGT